LANLGLEVAIIEKREINLTKLKNEPGRLLAIAKASIDIFEKYGISGLFNNEVQEITYIRVLEEATSSYLDFDPSEIGLDKFGVMIEEYILFERLYQKVINEKKIHLIYKATITDIAFDHDISQIKLNTSTQLNAKLIIACDGKNSWIRKYYGIGVQKINYNQYAIVCDIQHEKEHEGAAIEKFLPQGPFAILPKVGGYQSSIVWTCESKHVDAILSLDAEARNEIIKQKFGEHLGSIEIISDIKFFPLELIHAKSYIGKHLALAGDSAHSIHPIAGQGLNLGMRDLDSLVALIKENMELGLSIGSQVMLEQYERSRQPDNNFMIEATHNLNLLFSNNFFPVKLVRGIGLRLINKLPFARKLFMRYAMGLL
jgi:2-octaprenyl-6-methoxyphenol hydroxylase